jgi:hypothetical protein
MIHGRSMLSPTATAAEMWQARAWLAARAATALQSDRKKTTLYVLLVLKSLVAWT